MKRHSSINKIPKNVNEYLNYSSIGSLNRMEAVCVRFEVLRALITKNVVTWDVTPCGSCKSRRFDESNAFIIMVEIIRELGVTLAVTSN
jgi:hypothetical protein